LDPSTGAGLTLDKYLLTNKHFIIEKATVM